MTEMENMVPTSEPRNRSTGALILFLLIALLIPLCMLVYHIALWSAGQAAIISSSQADKAWAEPIGLAAQGILLTGIMAALWHFTKDERFKPVYAGWLGASVIAFPALLLRFLGPNRDQLGSILQIIICLAAFFIVSKVRKVNIDWRANNLWLAFLLAAFGVAPFVVFGAFGSPTDVLLSLLAGLSFGLLAALLMESTTGNKFLDAFGIGAVLALLGSAIGYDGAQLILLAILPAFAFAIATVTPSRARECSAHRLISCGGIDLLRSHRTHACSRRRSCHGGARFGAHRRPWLVGGADRPGHSLCNGIRQGLRCDARDRSGRRGRGLGGRHSAFLYGWPSGILR